MQKNKAKKSGSTTESHKHNADLVGLYFLVPSTEEGWQGRILGKVGDYYKVQLYEWFMGEPSQQRLVSLEKMLSWTFYDYYEAWVEAANRVVLNMRAPREGADSAPQP